MTDRAIARFLVLLMLVILDLQAAATPLLPEGEPAWKNVTVDGKKTAVFSLFADSRGLMWLGTNSGLYFYDGVMARPVGGDSLAGTQIYAIVEHSGHLYLGSNNGLLVYDYASGDIAPVEPATPKEIRSMLAVGNELWIGGLNGICRLDFATMELTDCSEGLPHRSVYSLLRDSRGILYAGTYNGPARRNSLTGAFEPMRVVVDGRELTPLFANCMLESDNREHIYVGTDGALLRYTPLLDRWENTGSIESTNVKSLTLGSPGHLLVGTDNGVYDLDGDSVRHYRHDSRREQTLADNEIWCIFADNDRNVWAGHERGFSIASNSTSRRTIKLSTLARSGEGNEIHSIYRDSRGDLWLGGTNGIIRLSDGSQPRWYRHSSDAGSLSHNRVRAILEDSDRQMWFATDAGLNRLDPQTDKFHIFHITDADGGHNSNWVYALVEDGDYFWQGSFLNGLHYIRQSKLSGAGGTVASDFALNAETNLPDGESLANDLVNDVVRDHDGNLWILLFRDNALARYSPTSRRLTKFDIHELTGGYPADICLDRNGRIWCAFSGGAIIFNSRGEHTTVRFPHTNSDETILAIGPVGDGVWISTRSNVWNIDGRTLTPSLLAIPQNSFTAVYEDTASGKVLLGGIDEILEVDTHDIADAADIKAVRMVLVDDGRGRLDLSDLRSGADGLTIPYGGSVTLVVSSLNYSPESVQRYMYKLADSPADTLGGWHVMPEGTNAITLPDLRMGDYRLLVRTVSSPAAAIAVPLRVDPPPALSKPAICLYVLIVILLICWAVWFTRRRNLRTFREQERRTALENVEKKLTFLSSISHDLKTPLSMIIGPVSLMKEQAKDPESKKSLENIYDNAVRLNNMIHRTLELQHLEDADESLLILSTFDVVEFCRGVFEVFRDNNPQKTFVFHSACPQLLIEADAVKLESVITNLLSNACKYSDEGATISCGISRNDGEVEIVVSDDGVGISDVDQPLVFQRLFRAPATADLREGTGLGLYLIKKYLELMHGNINLYSKEGQGTTFVVTLPASDNKTITRPHSGPTDPDSDRPRILIVEDNPQISEFISGFLDDRYICFSAENGRAGLAIAASVNPDLIIVDEMMPIMSGLEMVRRMKQHPRLATVPIIMLTAKTDNRTETESIKAGIDAFMTKPFEPAALLGRISQLLKTRSDIREKLRMQAIADAESRPIEAESVSEKQLARISRIIEENIADPELNVNLLSEKSGIHNKQLYRLIKKYMGVAPLDYIRNVRLQKAAALLSQHRFTVSEISYMVGFKTPAYFAKCFQNRFGVSPSRYHSDDETVSPKK